ncbi:MAG: hypothetical protein IIA59_06130 [Candidatus Marinimicrobia bacterium]|nr:hypothetical protein [Candidatus Neomarinimicrobiota bacterium]
MKFKLFTLAALLLAAAPASAKIWRVDNNAGNEADYTTLQMAHDSSAAGDTLYIAGSGTSYGSLTMTKQLIIFGPGYFLGENLLAQATFTSAFTGGITINAGSEGSLLEGIQVINVITINANNITVKRCLVKTTAGVALIRIGSGVSNIVITQCYVQNSSGACCLNRGIELLGNNSNVIITNSYMQGNGVGHYSILGTTTSVLQLRQNVLGGNILLYNSDIRNNILEDGTFSGTGNTILNNIGNSTQFGTSNGNQENVDMATVFDSTGTTDGQWQLITGSPAIGAADDGGDIGMYGGAEPYVLSGVPHLPSISFLKVPTTGSKALGLPVQIKVKGNN